MRMGSVNGMSKGFALIFILIMAISSLSLMLVKSANAQTVPKPSVSEFTAKYVDRSYTVPASTTIDQYTGQKVTNPSYYVENRTLEIAIKNQPFTPYVDNSTGAQWKITLMYQIRTRGHFAQNWTNLYFVDDGFLPASNSDYTTVSYSLGEGSPWGNLQANAQVDFQVEAMVGYVSRGIGFASWYFSGETSDWSSTQTVTIPTNSVSPTPTTTVPEFPTLIILPLFAVATLLSIGLIRKIPKK
jgi:hypothetical protein